MGWVQADRGGRPLQAAFLVGEQNAAYLAGEPADDARFVAVFAHALEHAGGYTAGGSKGGLQENCCRISFPMTRRARRPFRAMAGRSPTTLSIFSSLYTRTET